jgi:DNA-binding transcriptional MerR regulator
MTDARLTIGQVAEYAGVTVRAIRHYHDRGLLPEPARDASGYRRYDARALLDLLRIKVLADAGVPLARVAQALAAGPEELDRTLREIDAALSAQVLDLERRRERIAALAAGERALLAPDLAAYLEELRAAGVGPEGVAVERDGWVLLYARHPQRAPHWLADKRAHLADPEFRRLTRAYDEAAGWRPDDPRLPALADALVRYARRSSEGATLESRLDDPTTVAVVTAHLDGTASDALRRLHDLVAERERRDAAPPPGDAPGPARRRAGG